MRPIKGWEKCVDRKLEACCLWKGVREQPSMCPILVIRIQHTQNLWPFLKILTHFQKCVFSFCTQSTLQDDSISRQTDAITSFIPLTFHTLHCESCAQLSVLLCYCCRYSKNNIYEGDIFSNPFKLACHWWQSP